MADVFDSADDMRDFAANFFESFFFGGGFPGFKGGGGGGGKPKRARDSKAADGDKKGSNANSDEDTDDDDYTDDDYDEDYYDDDYSDDDYADLHDFFSQPPPGWRGPPGFRGPKGGGSAGGWFGNATGKGSHPGNQFDEYQRARRQREGGSSVDDDELFERLERMRKEAARYAAELAKKEDEARRAKQPLEKLQRPTLVSRTDTSITLNLYRSKNTNQTLPKDRCWELSLTKERERNYSVFTSVKGKTVVTVSDLTPGTRYCFKARVGRVESGESAGVSEWGPYSVESAYATSGKAPPENHAHKASTQHKEPEKAAEGVVTTNGEDTTDGAGSTATLSKKAKKRAAKEKHAAEEAEAAAKGASQAAAETSAAQDRQAALRRAAEAAAEREMAEMEEIRRKMESKKQREKSTVDASLSHQGNAEGHQPTGQPPSGNTEGLSKKALQRKKKKEKLAAETAQRLEHESASAAAVTDEEFARRLQAEEGGYAYNPGALESDEALARRLQAEEDKYKTHAPPTQQPPTQQPYNPVQAAPAMPMPKGRTQPQYAQPTTQSAFGAASNAAAAPPLPRGAPPPPPPGGPPPNANRLPPPKASAAPGPFGAPPPQQTYGGHPPPLPPGPHPGPIHPHGQYGGGPPPLPPGAPPPPPGGPPPIPIGGGGMRPNPYAANTAPNPYDPYANPYSNVHEYGQSSGGYRPAQQMEDGFTRTQADRWSAPDPWAAINGDGGEDGADAGFELPFNGGFELPSDDDFVGAVRDHAETRPTQRIQRGPGSVPHPNGGSFHAGSPQDAGLFVPGASTHAAWSSSPPGDGRGGTGHHDSIHHAHSNGYGYDSNQQQRHDSAYTANGYGYDSSQQRHDSANGYGYDSGQQYPQRQYQNAPGSSPPVGSFGNDSYGGAFGTSPGSAYGGSFGGGGGVWSGLESGRQPPASSSGQAKRGGLGGVSLEGDMDALNLGGGGIFPPGGSSFSFLEENGGN